MQVASKSLLWGGSLPKDVTVLILRTKPGAMSAMLCVGDLAPGSVGVTVDWGDGTREEYEDLNGRTHTYTKAGDFKVKISDDISSLGYTEASPAQAHYRDMLIELVQLGSKVKKIAEYGFNNCHNMRGVMNLPNVDYIESYAFGTTLGITDYILPSMRTLEADSFYFGSSPTRMYIDNATYVSGSFWEYYGPNLTDMFIRGKTCEEIKAMGEFPFMAGAGVRFHGSDGIVLGSGEILH